MNLLDRIYNLFKTTKSEPVKTELVLRNSYDFVDMGCGSQPLRVIDLAKEHPDWYLMAIDPDIFKTELKGNVHLVRGLAEVVLANLPEQSIRQANSDYFLLTEDAEQVYDTIINLLSSRLTADGVLYIRHRKDKQEFLRDTLSQNGLEIVDMKRLRGSNPKYLPGVAYDLKLMKAIKKYVKTGIIPQKYAHLPEFFTKFKGREEVWQPMEYVIKHK